MKCFMGYETNCLVSFFLYFTGKSYRKKSVVFLCSILTNSKKIVLYKYKVKITNKENQTESTTKTFIVKLNDGTDFEMSFNVD